MISKLQQVLGEDLKSLRVELIDVGISSHHYVRKMNGISRVFSSSRLEFLDELIALRYLENGIILHLTNMDDDSSNFSFRALAKKVNKQNLLPNDIILKMGSMLSEYRKHVNPLKVKHRNRRIAHLNATEEVSLTQFLDFNSELKPLISEAYAIGRFFLENDHIYLFKIGSIEGTINYGDIGSLHVKLDQLNVAKGSSNDCN